MKKIFTFLVLFATLFSDAQSINHGQHRITLDPTLKPFYHGVASGDPLPDGVMIWTRVTPDSGNVNAIPVFWQIAKDLAFTQVVNYGKIQATSATDFTVKVDVCGLQPSTYYYFMFSSNGKNSVIARTKTAPSLSSNNDSARFAVVSCASWEHGYFNACLLYTSPSPRDS